MSASHSTLEQVRLIAWLRWRIFLSMMRAPAAKMEMVARALIAAGAVVITVLICAGLGAGSYAIMKLRPARIGTLLWGIFLVAQFLPLLISATQPSFHTRSLLRFPLRFSSYLILGLSYTLFDPAALSSLLWFASVAAGASIAVPQAAAWICGAILLLAAFSVLMNRLAISWIERLLARQRSREIVFLLFVLGMLSIQKAGAVARRWHNELAPIVEAVGPYIQLLPPGMAAGAIGAWSAPATSAQLLATLMLWSGLVFWLLRKRLLAQYRGEDLSEATPQSAREKPEAATAGWSFAHLPFLTEQRAALVGKELRYLFRNAVTVLQLGIPFFLIIFFGLLMDGNDKELSFFRRRPETILPSAMGYSIFIALPIAHNSLSFESRGMQLLLMAPVRFRDVFLAKNMALALAILGQGVAVYVLVQWLFAAQEFVMVAATFTALLFMLLLNFTVGNLISVYFPKAFDFGSFQQRQSPWSVLIGIATQIVGMGVVYLVYAIALLWGNRWAAVLIYALMTAAMAQVYWMLLDRTEEIAIQRRELILTEVCRN